MLNIDFNNVVEAKWSEASKGDSFTGTYKGIIEPKGNITWDRYVFQDSEGQLIISNGAGSLKYWMNQIAVESIVEITYLGKKKVNGYMTHQFQIISDGVQLIPFVDGESPKRETPSLFSKNRVKTQTKPVVKLSEPTEEVPF